MKINDINKLKNKKYIVLLPGCDYDIKASVEYSFENVFYLDYELNNEDAKTLIDFVNKNNTQLIVFDYSDFYRRILPYIRKNIKIKWVYKNNLSGITDGNVRATFTNLMEFCDRNIVDTIGCLDESTYEVLKNSGYNAKHILLDVDCKDRNTKKTNSIGLIGNDYNPNHNTYNQLSALKMIDYSYVKIVKNMPATKHFIDFFTIREKDVNNIEEAMTNNSVNLYCNFTFTNYELILKSMDMGIPCLLGNTEIFNKYPKLKKYLVLESDDDINEISYKIEDIKEKRDEILKEYNKFREEYKIESKNSITKFLK